MNAEHDVRYHSFHDNAYLRFFKARGRPHQRPPASHRARAAARRALRGPGRAPAAGR